jgi:hypothetical protein
MGPIAVILDGSDNQPFEVVANGIEGGQEAVGGLEESDEAVFLAGEVPGYGLRKLDRGKPRSARVDAIGDAAVADRDHSDRLLGVGELVEDAVGADPQRAQAAKPAAKRVPSSRFALEQAERIGDRVDQGPVEREQLATGAASEDKLRQRSGCVGATLGELVAELSKGDRFGALDLGEPGLQGGHRIGIGEDLGGLLEGLVLIDRNQGGGGRAIAGDEDVIAPVADLVEQIAEIAT